MPNRWIPGKTAEDFQRHILQVKVIAVREETDVTQSLLAKQTAQAVATREYELIKLPDKQKRYVGYLMFVRDKES